MIAIEAYLQLCQTCHLDDAEPCGQLIGCRNKAARRDIFAL